MANCVLCLALSSVLLSLVHAWCDSKCQETSWQCSADDLNRELDNARLEIPSRCTLLDLGPRHCVAGSPADGRTGSPLYGIAVPVTGVLAALVAKNSSVTFLTFDCNGVDDAAVVQIREALEVNTVLESLSLRDNNIGDVGAQELAKALKINVALRLLDLTGNGDIDDNGLHNLSMVTNAKPNFTLLIDQVQTCSTHGVVQENGTCLCEKNWVSIAITCSVE